MILGSESRVPNCISETPKPTSHSNDDNTAALPDQTVIPSCDQKTDDHVIPPPSGENQLRTNQHNPEPLKSNGADLDQGQSMSDPDTNDANCPDGPEHDIPNEANDPYHRTLREGRKSPAQELTDDFNSKVKHAEQEHTAILEKYVRQAKKVAKKKKRLEQKKTKKVESNTKIIANKKCSASPKTTSSPSGRPRSRSPANSSANGSPPEKRKRPRIRTDTLKSPNLEINHQELVRRVRFCATIIG